MMRGQSGLSTVPNANHENTKRGKHETGRSTVDFVFSSFRVFVILFVFLAKRAATTRFAATARFGSQAIERLAPRLGVGQVAEVVLDGFAMALRHALSQLLQSPGLFARGQ